MKKQTIFLDFGVLDEQAEVEVTLEWVPAEVGTVEEGKKMEPDSPAGYVVKDVWSEIIAGLWGKYVISEHFASAVHSALRDEGVDI